MLSSHLRFGLPLLLFHGTSIVITLLPKYSSSLLNTCPYHHVNILSCTFLDISPTFVVPLILSFLILSGLVIPLTHHNILISATSNLLCFLHCPRLGTVHHCWSYNCLVYFPLDSQTYSSVAQNPRYLFQFFHHYCILCVISAYKSPFSTSVAPRYLNVFTLYKLPPCTLISEFPSKFPSPLNLR